ncbi:MAG: glycerophosphodiester phosphodiesterase [Terriglobales bacterium]
MPAASRNAVAASPSRPLLLGHRGARNDAPENTLAAFDLALEHGCDGFEFDVLRTADGKAIICHDAKLAGVEVARANYAGILQRGRLTREQAPLLEDVLERYGDSAFLDIEIKVAGLEDQVLEALRRYPPRRGFVVSSFLAEILKDLRARDARVPLGLICDTLKELGRWPRLPIEYIIPHHKLLTYKLIEEVHAARRKVLVWTVNSKREMLRLAKASVEGIISDDTRRLVRALGGNA